MVKFILGFLLGFIIGISLFLLFQIFLYNSNVEELEEFFENYERKIENGRSNYK